jgi:putative ABC transport system permease protein
MFRLLGRNAAVGQTFVDGNRDGVVLSDGFWRRRYHADRSVIGRHVNVSGTPRTIIGVMPADFIFPYRTMLGPSGFARAQAADMWLPVVMEGRFFRDSDGQLARQARFLGVIGRLRPSTTIDQARADVARVTSQLAQEFPAANEGWSGTLLSLHDQTVGALRPALVLLLFGVGLVLLMACVNLASLLLARSVSRQRELTVRSALGASPRRIGQQLLIESLVLSIAGGALAIALLYGGVQAIRALAPPDTPRLNEIHPNLTVLFFMFAIALVTGLVIGLFPAALSSRTDVRAAMADGGRGATLGRGRRRLRATFVVAEISLAVVLTIGATLLLRSFVHVMTVDPGFKPDRLLTFQVNIPARLTTPEARIAFYDDLFSRLERVPDVTSAGGTTRLPLGSTNVSTQVAIEGRDLKPAQYPEVEFRRALHHYFDAMGIPLIKGRLFDDRDTPVAAAVCILNRTAAIRLFPGDDPIGHRVRIGTSATGPWLTIVGIVGDVRHGSLEEVPNPELYIFGRQNPPVAPFIAMRTGGDPSVVAANVRSAMKSFEPLMPLFDLKAMTEIRRESVAERRFTLVLVGMFGGLALLMAVFGVYGVMAIVVAERTTEVGIRLALGAPRAKIAQLILGHAAALGFLGIAIGTAVTLVLTPLMTNLLFGVSPADPWSFISMAVALMLAAVVAALIPARRAMLVDPVVAMRQ